MSAAPMAVYKYAGKWWYDCRVCNTSNPHWSPTHPDAMARADRHFAQHLYSAFHRDAPWRAA